MVEGSICEVTLPTCPMRGGKLHESQLEAARCEVLGTFEGARVQARMRTDVADLGDGRYLLMWTSTRVGLYTARVFLGGARLPGSGMTCKVTPAACCAPQCTAQGREGHGFLAVGIAFVLSG